MSKLVILFVLKFLKIYKIIISPLIGSNCRYQPTCSHYCEEAIIKHGLMKGLKLTLKRLMKCHPWGESGFDPVPDE